MLNCVTNLANMLSAELLISELLISYHCRIEPTDANRPGG